MILNEIPHETMTNLVLDYLISQGHREAAELLCEDANIPFPRDAIQNLDQRMRIRDCILEGKIEQAMEKAVALVPTLLRCNPILHLRLLQQHLIELLRERKVEESLHFAQSIADKVDEHPEMRGEIERTFAMIAFEKPEESPFASLLEQSHRQMVANDVNSAILEAMDRPSAPRLELLFRMIIWARKQLNYSDTPEDLDRLFKNPNADP